MSSVAGNAVRRSRSLWSGVLVGLGVAGFVDETVFHQLLHWHHFYDKGTADAGLVSDGLFHTGSWAAIVAGLFLFAELRRRDGWAAGTCRGQVLRRDARRRRPCCRGPRFLVRGPRRAPPASSRRVIPETSLIVGERRVGTV